MEKALKNILNRWGHKEWIWSDYRDPENHLRKIIADTYTQGKKDGAEDFIGFAISRNGVNMINGLPLDVLCNDALEKYINSLNQKQVNNK